MKKITYLFLITLLVTSCKNQKKAEPVNKTLKNTFAVSVLISKEDVFTLYYLDEKSKKYNEELSTSIIVKTSDSIQEIIFNLPSKVNGFRLGLGSQKDLGEIKIKEIRTVYNGKNTTIDNNELGYYFLFNRYIKNYISQNGTMQFRSFDKDYNPFITSKQDFLDLIKN